MFAGAIDGGEARFGPGWADEFEVTLAALFPTPERLAAAAQAYARFALDLMRRQRRFERERTYPAKSYAEAAAEVYLDAAFMADRYLPGLVLAHHLWPHHVRHLRFFESAFLAEIAGRGSGGFVEVGIGTGLYSRRTLELLGEARGTGYDISPASIAFAAAHLDAFGLSDRFETVLRDVVADPIEPTPRLICIEVLEHLEDPLGFLRVLRAALMPGGRAFITAALNAAHVDHIHLYRTPGEVAAQLESAGFDVEQALLATAYPPPSPGVPVPAVAAFVVG
jgi:SAM-dependent methyltransferase